MSENGSAPKRYVLPLGSALVLMATVPFEFVAANAATPIEKLAALRAAASTGGVGLYFQGEDGTLSAFNKSKSAQFDRGVDFDRSAPFDKQVDKLLPQGEDRAPGTFGHRRLADDPGTPPFDRSVTFDKAFDKGRV